MPRYRSYLDPSESTIEETFSLSSEESHHLLRVRRAKVEDPVTVFDGRGNEYKCFLEGVSAGKATLRVDIKKTYAPPSCRIILAQTILKSQKMDQVIQRATELGASHLVPVLSERAVALLSNDRYENRFRRWKLLTVEACKQSGNLFLPTIGPITALKDFCGQPQEQELRLIGSLEPQATNIVCTISEFRQTHSINNPASILCLIGPEGDFTREEYQIAHKAGFIPITLSPNTLRSETAATVSVALLRQYLD
ncbi:MAG: Ribosomal RNA small subunit methyltransferase E [Candidatus Moanabacter tarae]|uniref:Ribosomal RNA small subunit methyltransferase E n=1 Tax=Candidatus Moanibacter tarae TaxID=2200854 RepID=A0A2Z4AKK3_9BACT|nr:MAG: Ribosomal RNA small subunit methyltransferase E [Candidatus Moanabacter tarae]|tara:strand:- start:25786 stop:26541 length:756 start_codon:yes stop_codon:yes gene_type:complete